MKRKRPSGRQNALAGTIRESVDRTLSAVADENVEAFVRTVIRNNPELQLKMARLIDAYLERALSDLGVQTNGRAK